MSLMVTELVNIINKQLDIYNYLIGLSDEKREAIISNDVNDLKKLTELENKLIEQNLTQEKSRLSLIEDIALVLNHDPFDLTISKLLTLIEGTEGYDDLLIVSKEMRKSIELLKEANDKNRILIDNSLEFIDYSINAIRSTYNESPAVDIDSAGNTRPLFDVTS